MTLIKKTTRRSNSPMSRYSMMNRTQMIKDMFENKDRTVIVNVNVRSGKILQVFLDKAHAKKISNLTTKEMDRSLATGTISKNSMWVLVPVKGDLNMREIQKSAKKIVYESKKLGSGKDENVKKNTPIKQKPVNAKNNNRKSIKRKQTVKKRDNAVVQQQEHAITA